MAKSRARICNRIYIYAITYSSYIYMCVCIYIYIGSMMINIHVPCGGIATAQLKLGQG